VQFELLLVGLSFLDKSVLDSVVRRNADNVFVQLGGGFRRWRTMLVFLLWSCGYLGLLFQYFCDFSVLFLLPEALYFSLVLFFKDLFVERITGLFLPPILNQLLLGHLSVRVEILRFFCFDFPLPQLQIFFLLRNHLVDSTVQRCDFLIRCQLLGSLTDIRVLHCGLLFKHPSALSLRDLRITLRLVVQESLDCF
jgi:hypothetical protein